MTLDESYRYCERVARGRARNFYYSFLLLSKNQRSAMCAVYAFMRFCDDLSDDETRTDRRAAIEQWRGELTGALSGKFSGHPVWPALNDTVEKFRIPHSYFFEMIEGVSSDLEPRRIQTFDELYRYCYQVASVVGLTIIHIFGFDSAHAPALAEKCGVAFQLTNILRDVSEDARLDRIYLPAEDLSRFGVQEFVYNDAFRALMSFEAERARDYYRESRPLVDMVHAGSRRSLWALIEIYRRLLGRIEKAGYDVLSQRVRVPNWEKLSILAEGALFK